MKIEKKGIPRERCRALTASHSSSLWLSPPYMPDMVTKGKAHPTVMQQCCSQLSQWSSESRSTAPLVLDWLNNSPLRHHQSNVAQNGAGTAVKRRDAGLQYMEIYLCYMCGEEFSSKETLQKHQIQCSSGTLSLSIPSTPPVSEAPSPGPPTVSSDDTISSFETSLSSHLSPQPLSMALHDFMAALDLVPASRARKLRMARRRNTECETIDLEEPQTSLSPSTPRTPKSLISQLSRDASSANGIEGAQSRRRLSYLAQSSEKTGDKNEEDSGSDGEGSSSGSEDAEDRKLHKKSLLSIDVTSALGQRVLKHMTSEAHVPIILNAEQFCHTPIKDMYQDRLRARLQAYPITYKLTHKRLRQQQHCHVYKFTRKDKTEFMEKMKTGLDRHSRDLLQHLRKCSVMLKRLSLKTLCKWKPSLNKISVSLKPLTDKEITYWTAPKASVPSEISPAVFPDGPTIMLTDIDRVLGLKRKLGEPLCARRLSASHCVSEVANAELQQQRLTVYRSLLLDLSHNRDAVEPSIELGQQCYLRDGYACSTKSKDKIKGPRKDHFPVLSSMLNSLPSEKSDPCRLIFPVNLKNPLKVEVLSQSWERRLICPTHEDKKNNSTSDDSFSVRTSSSDEESPAPSACCALCTRRQSCECAEPQKLGVSSPAIQPEASTKVATDLGTSESSFSSPCSEDSVGQGHIAGMHSVLDSIKGSGSTICSSQSVSLDASQSGDNVLKHKTCSTHLRKRIDSMSGTQKTGSERHLVCSDQKSVLSLQRELNTRKSAQLQPAQTCTQKGKALRGSNTAIHELKTEHKLEIMYGEGVGKEGMRKTSMQQAKNCSVGQYRSGNLDGQMTKVVPRRQRRCKRKADDTVGPDGDHGEEDVSKNRILRSGSTIASRIQGLVFENVLSCTAVRQSKQKKIDLSSRENASSGGSKNLSNGLCHTASSKNDSSAVGTRASSRTFCSNGNDKKESLNSSSRVNMSLATKAEVAKTVSKVSTESLLETQRAQFSGSGSPGLSKLQANNPFLLGKEQAVLFSSTIRAQARRQLPGPEELHAGTRNRLMMGNTSGASGSHLDVIPKPFIFESSQQKGVLGFLSPSLNSTHSQNQCSDTFFSIKTDETFSSKTSTRATVCKRLSPLQMLSVLESAKEGTMSPGRRLLLRKSKGKFSRAKKSPKANSKKSGYHLRPLESNNSAKKMRLGSCV